MQIAQVAERQPDAAEAALRPYFDDVRLGSSAGRGFEFALTAHEITGATLLDYRWDAPVVRGHGEADGHAVLRIRAEGTLRSAAGDLDTSRPFLFADRLWADAAVADVRLVQFDCARLAHVASRALGDDGFRLRAEQLGQVTAEGAAQWERTTDFAMELAGNGAADDPIVGASLAELLMTTYLGVFPTNWSEARRLRDDRRAVPAALRRAKAFVDEHASSPIGVTDIAEAARMSTRGLQAAFRREFGITPSEYLRRVRLAAARERLLAADPEAGDTVSVTARAAGFAHVARFAATYREAFGELPSETLRR